MSGLNIATLVVVWLLLGFSASWTMLMLCRERYGRHQKWGVGHTVTIIFGPLNIFGVLLAWHSHTR